MPDDQAIRIVRGDLSVEELAALATVLLAVTRAAGPVGPAARPTVRWRWREPVLPRSWRSSDAAA